MWTRRELKEKAKNVLRVSYWKAFLVSLIIGFIGAGSFANFKYNMPMNRSNNPNMKDFDFNNFSGSSFNHGKNFQLQPFNQDMNFLLQSLFPMMIIFMFIFMIVIILYIAFKIFVSYPLAVGGTRYFVSAAQGTYNLDYLGFSFQKSRYLNIVKTVFLKNLFIFLWTLLFVIPGIIKYYSYSMVEFIIADNPKMDYSRAIELSRTMTRGNKFKIFILDLSFIGWYLLGTILFGIGIFFVNPYAYATKTELYLHFRNKALSDGICTPEEFGLVAVEPSIEPISE